MLTTKQLKEELIKVCGIEDDVQLNDEDRLKWGVENFKRVGYKNQESVRMLLTNGDVIAGCTYIAYRVYHAPYGRLTPTLLMWIAPILGQALSLYTLDDILVNFSRLVKEKDFYLKLY